VATPVAGGGRHGRLDVAGPRLVRPTCAYAALAVVLGFAVVANGHWLRSAATTFDMVILPMKSRPDWAAAKGALAPRLA
jgi:hypothetical protein